MLGTIFLSSIIIYNVSDSLQKVYIDFLSSKLKKVTTTGKTFSDMVRLEKVLVDWNLKLIYVFHHIDFGSWNQRNSIMTFFREREISEFFQ